MAKEIVLANSLAELPRLHSEVESFAEQHEIGADIAFKVDLSLDEVFTNIVRHGYADREPHEIAIRISLQRSCLRIRVEDDGFAYNPLLAPEPDIDAPLEDRRPGGLGVYLVKTMMDRVSYRRIKDKNVLHLSKWLLPKQE